MAPLPPPHDIEPLGQHRSLYRRNFYVNGEHDTLMGGRIEKVITQRATITEKQEGRRSKIAGPRVTTSS